MPQGTYLHFHSITKNYNPKWCPSSSQQQWESSSAPCQVFESECLYHSLHLRFAAISCFSWLSQTITWISRSIKRAMNLQFTFRQYPETLLLRNWGSSEVETGFVADLLCSNVLTTTTGGKRADSQTWHSKISCSHVTWFRQPCQRFRKNGWVASFLLIQVNNWGDY